MIDKVYRLLRRRERLETLPAHTLLRQLLAIRHRALISKPLSDAVARHEDLLARSASYRSIAHADSPTHEGKGDSVVVAGLSFFVPADSRKPGSLSDRVLTQQWLPLKEIQRSRDLAVGTAMIDIGANIGTTSIPRVVLGDFQYIYAAEPEPANYAALVANVISNKLCGIVLPDRVALGSVDGSVTLECSGKLGSHRVVQSNPALREGKPPRVVVVPSMTLDRWVEKMGIDLDRVAFVKCDTQGWEGHVLRGAAETLRHKHIAWQLEFWPEALVASGVSLEEFVDLIAANFSHWLNLRDQFDGPSVHSTTRLRATILEFMKKGERKGFTDLMVFNTDH